MALTIEDRLELMALPTRYGHAIDDRDWDALRRIFTEDAVVTSHATNGVRNGVDEIVAFMDTWPDHPLGHMMTNLDITEADGKVLMRFCGLLPIRNEDGSLMPSRVRWVRYYDEVVRTPAGWRVKHRLVTRRPKDFRPTATDLAIEARYAKPA